MDTENLEFIVLDQWESLKKRDIGFPRDLLNKMERLSRFKINIVVTGHRRSGKSTFILQIMNKYYKNKFYYLNIADERLNSFSADDFQKLHEIFIKNFGKRKIFVFDEIQGVPSWNKFVNRMYENGYRFFITGSNAELLSKEISTYLTGRHLDLTIYPFSFKEYLNFHKIRSNVKSTYDKAKILNAIDKYIKYGGFPEVVVYDAPELLENIHDDVITKDVIIRGKIKEIKNFKELELYLISNIGKEMSYNSLKKQFGFGSVNTVKGYIYLLTNAFLLFEVNQFAYSKKKQEILPKKIYCIDTGMAYKMGFRTSRDYGRMIENLVFIELKRRYKNIFYWKNKKHKEVDFLIFENHKVTQAIQVCTDVNNKQIKEREESALLLALTEFKLDKGIIITKDLYKTVNISGKKINYIPLWKWLLSEK